MSKELRKSQFFHFRTEGKDGKVGPKGGATVCYLPIGATGIIIDSNTGDEPKFGKALIGVSVCSLDDPFNKTIGRGRSISDALHRKMLINLCNMEDFVLIAEKLVKENVDKIITNKQRRSFRIEQKIQRALTRETQKLDSDCTALWSLKNKRVEKKGNQVANIVSFKNHCIGGGF